MAVRVIDIVLRKLVYGVSQARIAASLGISDPKLSRIMSGAIRSDNITEDTGEAFMAEFPILDALLPSSDTTKTRTLTHYKVGEAPTVLEMAEAALATPGISETQRWVFMRNAAHALLLLGAQYDEANDDDEEPHHRLLINVKRLEKARQYFLDLVHLKSIPTVFKQTLEIAVHQNNLAIDMMIEKANGKIERTSAALKGFLSLFKQVAEICPRQLYAEPEDMPPNNLVLRTLTLYAGSSLAELLIESGQANAVKDVVEKLVRVFGADQHRSLQIFLQEICWKHNKAVYSSLFDVASSATPGKASAARR